MKRRRDDLEEKDTEELMQEKATRAFYLNSPEPELELQ